MLICTSGGYAVNVFDVGRVKQYVLIDWNEFLHTGKSCIAGHEEGTYIAFPFGRRKNWSGHSTSVRT